MSRRRVAIALVHHPVLDAEKNVVTTAITNLDVHDIARSARTYGCSDYFLIHPIAAQRELVDRICHHWREGSSSRRIPDRKEALTVVRVAPSLEDVYASLGGREAVEVWVTAARDVKPPMAFDEARAVISSPGKTVLVLFGTGWGLAPAAIDQADAALTPIRVAGTGYNHLSVRAACAITLDRLLG